MYIKRRSVPFLWAAPTYFVSFLFSLVASIPIMFLNNKMGSPCDGFKDQDSAIGLDRCKRSAEVLWYLQMIALMIMFVIR